MPRHPPDLRLAQRLREATSFRQEPHYFIHGLANNYGETSARVTAASDINPLKMPYRAPKANTNCERFMGSLRQKCLNQILILGSPHLQHIVVDYVTYFNRASSYRGIGQRIPDSKAIPPIDTVAAGSIIGRPLQAGLHHEYHRAA